MYNIRLSSVNCQRLSRKYYINSSIEIKYRKRWSRKSIYYEYACCWTIFLSGLILAANHRFFRISLLKPPLAMLSGHRYITAYANSGNNILFYPCNSGFKVFKAIREKLLSYDIESGLTSQSHLQSEQREDKWNGESIISFKIRRSGINSISE